MSKARRACFTLEFKLEAKAAQRVAAVVATLDASALSISEPATARRTSESGATGTKPVGPEQTEVSRLRCEATQLRKERNFLRRASAYFRKGSK